MNKLTLTTLAATLWLGTLFALPADAAQVSRSYQACEQAIADHLGEGRLRKDVIQITKAQGAGSHWINVRHRAAGADETQRYRVKCDTERSGDVAALNVADGAWKKRRSNQPPVAMD